MPPRAQVYIACVLLLAVAVAGLALTGQRFVGDWLAFGVLLVLATVAQLYTVRAPAYQSYHVTLVFLMAAALLVEPFLYVLVVAIPHVVEWAKERWTNSPRLRHWYLQPFNIATHILAGSAASLGFVLVAGARSKFLSVAEVTAIIVATVIYLLLNHFLIGLAISLARNVPLGRSGILELKNLQKDWALLLLGSAAVILWTLNPWWILLTLSPAAMMYYALRFPATAERGPAK